MRRYLYTLIILLFAAQAWAVPPPYMAQRGDLFGEIYPFGASIQVEKTTYQYDLRPVQGKGKVGFKATYTLKNPDSTQTLRLVLAMTAGRDAKLHFQGQPVEGTAREIEARFGRGFDKSKIDSTSEEEVLRKLYLPDGLYEGNRLTLVTYEIKLPRGTSGLEVVYDAFPQELLTWGTMTEWELSHKLTPAGQWGSFGTSDIEVLLPDGWELSESNLQELKTNGKATLSEVPEKIYLRFQQIEPVGTVLLIQFGTWGLGLLGLLLGWWILVRHTRKYYKRINSFKTWGIIVVHALILGIGIFLIRDWGQDWLEALVGEQFCGNYEYNYNIQRGIVLLVGVPLLVPGIAILDRVFVYYLTKYYKFGKGKN